MLALYRSSRQADALEEYRKVGALLSEELGIYPGSDLSDLYERLLRNDPALVPPREAPEPARAAEPPAATVARTLPYDLADFTGRKPELDGLLKPARRARRPRASDPRDRRDGRRREDVTGRARRAPARRALSGRAAVRQPPRVHLRRAAAVAPRRRGGAAGHARRGGRPAARGRRRPGHALAHDDRREPH